MTCGAKSIALMAKVRGAIADRDKSRIFAVAVGS